MLVYSCAHNHLLFSWNYKNQGLSMFIIVNLKCSCTKCHCNIWLWICGWAIWGKRSVSWWAAAIARVILFSPMEMYTLVWLAFASSMAYGLDLNSSYEISYPKSGKCLCFGKIAPICFSVAGRQSCRVGLWQRNIVFLKLLSSLFLQRRHALLNASCMGSMVTPAKKHVVISSLHSTK